jgi:hypothetical protein
MRKTLTQAELQRLEQITLQLQGPRAFSQAEVIAKLRLTESQREKIRQIEMEPIGSTGDLPGPHSKHFLPEPRGPNAGFAFSVQPPGFPSVGPQQRPLFRTGGLQPITEKVVTVLTPQQLTQWKQLTGAPFQGSVDLPPPGMPPHHGPTFGGPGGDRFPLPPGALPNGERPPGASPDDPPDGSRPPMPPLPDAWLNRPETNNGLSILPKIAEGRSVLPILRSRLGFGAEKIDNARRFLRPIRYL